MIMLLTALAGCTADAPPAAPDDAPATTTAPADDVLVATRPGASDEAASSLPAEASLAVGPATHLSLAIGKGWGRVFLEAEANGSLEVRVTHDEMADLSLFTRDGEGIMNETTAIHLFLFEEGTAFVADGAFRFEWWPTPFQSFWPHGSNFEEPYHDVVPLTQGRKYVLLASSTVTGFTLHFGDGAAPVAWELGSHPEHGHHFPAMQFSALATQDAGRVDRIRLWSVPEREYGPGLFVAVGWDHSHDLTAKAGIGYDRLGFRSATSPSPLAHVQLPTYFVDSGGGNSMTTVIGQSREPVSLELFREERETTVGVEGYTPGAQFLVIPDSPAP
jgi:hypothetical protein